MLDRASCLTTIGCPCSGDGGSTGCVYAAPGVAAVARRVARRRRREITCRATASGTAVVGIRASGSIARPRSDGVTAAGWLGPVAARKPMPTATARSTMPSTLNQTARRRPVRCDSRQATNGAATPTAMSPIPAGTAKMAGSVLERGHNQEHTADDPERLRQRQAGRGARIGRIRATTGIRVASSTAAKPANRMTAIHGMAASPSAVHPGPGESDVAGEPARPTTTGHDTTMAAVRICHPTGRRARHGPAPPGWRRAGRPRR